MRLRISLFLGLLVFYNASCVSNKNIAILDDRDFENGEPIEYQNEKVQYRIKTNDVLNVNIQSADYDVSRAFNINRTGNINIADAGTLYVSGYSVDKNGEINIPILGKVAVQGLTIIESQEVIQRFADLYLKNATVIVQIVSFRVTVLGEVRAPGHYYIYNGQATLFDVLGMAGDITEYGNRSNIKLVRQNDEGSEIIQIDLGETDILSSPYFYLLPNDVVYIQPAKSRAKRINLDIWPLVLSGVTTVILLVSVVLQN